MAHSKKERLKYTIKDKTLILILTKKAYGNNQNQKIRKAFPRSPYNSAVFSNESQNNGSNPLNQANL
jgi:hypothetical protein